MIALIEQSYLHIGCGIIGFIVDSIINISQSNQGRLLWQEDLLSYFVSGQDYYCPRY